jgi:hypothetical protein
VVVGLVEQADALELESPRTTPPERAARSQVARQPSWRRFPGGSAGIGRNKADFQEGGVCRGGTGSKKPGSPRLGSHFGPSPSAFPVTTRVTGRPTAALRADSGKCVGGHTPGVSHVTDNAVVDVQ